VFSGGGGPGRCSLEINIDDSAEVAEVKAFGARGDLRTLSGAAYWRRFECNAVMPQRPADFQVVKVMGRGPLRLVRHPGSNGGAAVVRISDPSRGRQTYIIDLIWRASGGPWDTPPPAGPGQGPGRGGYGMDQARAACQAAVTARLHRDGYQSVSFDRVVPQNNPGRNDWITGKATARRRLDSARFSFSCSVDFGSGRIRSVDVARQSQ